MSDLEETQNEINSADTTTENEQNVTEEKVEETTEVTTEEKAEETTEEKAEEKAEETTEEKAEEKASTSSSSFEEKLKNLNNTKDTTDEYDAKDIEDSKTMSIFAYLSLLVLIPLFAAKDLKFARFHCNQGLILLIVEIATSVVFGLLSLIPYVGWLFSILGWLIGICCLALSILGIINVANGKAKELPVIGKYKILN